MSFLAMVNAVLNTIV